MTSGRDPAEISVVVPAHRPLDYFAEALASIAAQTVAAIETVVVDDGGGVPEALVAAGLPGARLIRQDQAGPAAARNRAIAASSGAFVAFLDADDRWTPDALPALLKGFRDAPGVALVQGHIREFATGEDGREQVLGTSYLGFNLGATLVRRAALPDVPFDETLRRDEDVDFFMRLQEARHPRLMIPDHVLDYRRHPASLTAASPPRLMVGETMTNLLRLLHRARHRRPDGAAGEAPQPPPRLSVIMVVRNGRRHLPAALASLRAQSLPPGEILAVVAPSDDGTEDYLAGEADIRVVRQVGEGLAAARNQGLAEARGDIIAFLDHDDLWSPVKLERQIAVLRLFEGPAASIVHFRTTHDDDAGGAPTDAPEPMSRLGWTPSALVAHRAVFERVGGFDPAAGLGCDTDWFRRLRLLGVPCGVAAGVLLEKRRHGGNLSRDPAQNRAAMFQMIRKHRTPPPSG